MLGVALGGWSDALLKFVWNPSSAQLALPWFFLFLTQGLIVPHPFYSLQTSPYIFGLPVLEFL